MIAVDTNVLVAAHRIDAPFSETARRTLSQLAGSATPWAIPWPCVHEFVAVATHPRIFQTPTPIGKACDQVRAWMESPSLRLLSEDADLYWPAFSETLVASRIAGPRVHDARVATLCLTHGVTELLSADRDFSRFPALSVRNPLI